MRNKVLITAGLISALAFAAAPARADQLVTNTAATQSYLKKAEETATTSSSSGTAHQENMRQGQAFNPAAGIAQGSGDQESTRKIQTYTPDNVPMHDAKAYAEPPTPASLNDLQNIEKENKTLKSGLRFDIRKEAIKEAAVSYGARGGLAWRTYYIRQELEGRARYLDKIFDFRQLLIPAPSGLMIEPPVISESINAMLISDGGQEAAVSDRIYNIINNARIVSTSRTWRTYLDREWGDIEPPPDILRPENDEERQLWVDLVAKGWQEGIDQANEIFQDDLNVLMADFQGMVRYRSLLAQGMISPPYALQVDRGVTGGGEEMRIGDRAVQITGAPELLTGSDQWQPASR